MVTPVAEPFVTNHYVDISNQINTKMDALCAYQLEMRDPPSRRSFEHLEHIAHYRGYTVGGVAADAFVTVRTVR